MQLKHKSEMIQSLHRIQLSVQNKLSEEVNPLFIRIQVIIKELIDQLDAIDNQKDEKEYWNILYRAGDILDEMTTLIYNTIPIQTEVNDIKQKLIFYVPYLVDQFGERETHYIIGSKFQVLSGLW